MLAELSADVAPFAFTCAALPADTFAVIAFAGAEELSAPYAFDIDLVSARADLDPGAVVGRPATLVRYRGTEPVYVHGRVTLLEQGGRAPDGRGGLAVAYRVRLEPRLTRLAQTMQSRVFQDQTVEAITRGVLAEHGVAGPDVRFDLREVYPAREYVAQYNESDWAFVSRLWEHEGVFYYFEQDAEREVLVVADHAGAHAAIEPAAVRFQEDAGLVRGRVETIPRLRVRDRVAPASATLRDYNYRTPETDLTAESGAPRGAGDGEHYGYGDHYKDATEGERLARVRQEALAVERRVIDGESDCAGLAAGHTFTLEGHFRDGLNTDYLLCRVEHVGSAGSVVGEAGAPAPPSGDGAGVVATYANRFRAIPAATPYRPPRRTPVPKLPGLLTAKVETAGGPYAHLDEEGRYRVRMPFDRGDAPAAAASRPVRMAQPYSGPGYGLHFPNHAGTELVFACVNGDVDRPLALGTVPNPSQASPAVAANRMENVLRTWGGNALVMDDTQQAEHVRLEATKDHTEQVGDTQTVQVGASQTISVGGDRAKTVAGNQTETVQKAKTITVAETHTETVTGDVTQTFEANETRTVQGAHAETVAGDVTQTYEAAQTATVAGPKTTTVEGAVQEAYQSGQATDVTGAHRLSVSDRITIECGAASITLHSDGSIAIEGKSIEIGGKSIDLNAGGTITLNGKNVDVN